MALRNQFRRDQACGDGGKPLRSCPCTHMVYTEPDTGHLSRHFFSSDRVGPQLTHFSLGLSSVG